jgi:hypothetical protein
VNVFIVPKLEVGYGVVADLSDEGVVVCGTWTEHFFRQTVDELVQRFYVKCGVKKEDSLCANVALVCLCCGVTFVTAGFLYRAEFLCYCSHLLALCSCGVRELFACVVSSFFWFFYWMSLVNINTYCYNHTLNTR